MFNESMLAELGLVDREKLLASYQDFMSGRTEGREEWFMEAVTLEATLRAL
jgi:hypothetical protein